MESELQVQILVKAACISFQANDLGKDMNPSVLSWIMGK